MGEGRPILLRGVRGEENESVEERIEDVRLGNGGCGRTSEDSWAVRRVCITVAGRYMELDVGVTK